MSDDHREETERLWRAFKRDLSASIIELAGYRDGNHLERLGRTWERLCETNIDVASGEDRRGQAQTGTPSRVVAGSTGRRQKRDHRACGATQQ